MISLPYNEYRNDIQGLPRQRRHGCVAPTNKVTMAALVRQRLLLSRILPAGRLAVASVRQASTSENNDEPITHTGQVNTSSHSWLQFY